MQNSFSMEKFSNKLQRFLIWRSDRDHTLFVKSSGYQSELVVLRSVKRPEERPELAPESVAVRLKSLDPSGRELVIEEAEAP